LRTEKQIKKQLQNIYSQIEKSYKTPVGSGNWRYLIGYRNALEFVLNLE